METKSANFILLPMKNLRQHYYQVVGVFVVVVVVVLIFGCAGSSLLCRLFSSCVQWGLLSSRGAWASHCGGFSFL